MKKITLFFWMVTITGAAFMLYSVKDRVQTLQMQIAQAEDELEAETESLNVIAAEWEYLNRPERLRKLSSKYLASSYAQVEQIAVVEAIPFPAQMEAKNEPPKDKRLRRVQYQAEAGAR